MISTVIITSNEEDVLEECLQSLKGFSDEIIIVDSASKDRTLEIAKKYKAKIISHYLMSFAEQRNIGRDHARGDWIFYLDADERITQEFKDEVKEIISSYNENQGFAGYFVKRKTYYFGKDWNLEDKVQRLFYKKKLKDWYGVVHETPKVEGDLGTISSPILHLTHRNLEHMVEKTNKWSDFEANLRLKVDHPKMTWWRFPRVIMTGFLKSYFKDGGYRNGTEGIMESLYQSFSLFITYAKLWELQNKK